MLNLEELKNKYNAGYVFYNEGESTEVSGEDAPDSKIIKQMVVVLKQSIDAAEIETPSYIEFASDNIKVVFVFTDAGVYGLSVNPDAPEIIFEDKAEQAADEETEEEKEDKTKVKLKERKKIKIKSKKENEEEVKEEVEEKEEEKPEEPAPEKEVNYILNSDTTSRIEEIAEEYLEDFASDILSNLMGQVKVDKENPSAEQIDELLKKLQKSSSLIIGPSHAEEMIGKIKSGISG